MSSNNLTKNVVAFRGIGLWYAQKETETIGVSCRYSKKEWKQVNILNLLSWPQVIISIVIYFILLHPTQASTDDGTMVNKNKLSQDQTPNHARSHYYLSNIVYDCCGAVVMYYCCQESSTPEQNCIYIYNYLISSLHIFCSVLLWVSATRLWF